ncbi:MAG TPA: bifunctional DNA-binding transcriptional regulator/O6-methylguanine-DNA methyltransferase Ada [Candidatus Limnocylindrales bacterium]|nr:bifunctional DNA-binding transcriptional regulator/O6-methylguanine-DNA methyltransferase Ada [Candidatus Limnocylindrales bacterium]
METIATMMRTSKGEDLWAQVMARDSRSDGRFVYAVKSTGIFCRPTCPSRRPRRGNVEFFSSTGEAKSAGYRACLRCQPEQPNAQLGKIEAACRFIDRHLEDTLHLPAMAAHVGLSPFHFQRLFKRTLGISPRQYQQGQRARKYKQALQTEPRITDAVYEAGYSSTSRAYENGNSSLGMTPTSFRRGGEGVLINYTIIPSELGCILVATTARGVCAVRFGAKASELESELRQEFSAATLRRNDHALQPATEAIRSLLSGSPSLGRVPLDIQGTAFQQRVWQAIRQIPAGQTRSYSELAKQVGAPRAVRAVASACARNPVALVVPCHRVVQKSGKLAGYRWGLERKAALLRAESSGQR